VPDSPVDVGAIQPSIGGGSPDGAGGVSQSRIPAVLIGLFAIHAAVDAFLSQGDFDQIDARALVAVAAMGARIVQPPLLAIGAVFWPTRAAIRIPVTLTVTLLLVYANFFGIARSASRRPVLETWRSC